MTEIMKSHFARSRIGSSIWMIRRGVLTFTNSLVRGIVIFGFACFELIAQQPSTVSSASTSPQRSVLNRYCVTCHNEKLKTADLMLDKIDVENVATNAEVWERVIRKLRTGAMPPSGLPRPDKATYDSLATYFETAIDRASTVKPNPGRPAAIHRLNRTE